MKTILAFLLLIANLGFGQQSTQQNLPTLKEKVYLITDKEVYTPGENVWFTTYLVDESLLPSSISQIVHVDIIDPNKNVIESRLLQSKNGFAQGDFQLNEDFREQNYSIVAYTKYQLNFPEEGIFSKQISLMHENVSKENSDYEEKSISKNELNNVRPKQKFDVQFFPEGGELINQNPTLVAFKAIDATGRGVDIEGKIIDQNGELITEFSSLHLGMGIIPMIPELGKVYKAEIKYNGQNSEFKLPSVNQYGNALHVSELLPNVYGLKLTTNTNSGYVLGFLRGQEIFRYSLKQQEENLKAKIDNSPSGIIKFILTDEQFKPLAERQIFHYSDLDNNLNFDINSVPTQAIQQIEMDSTRVNNGLYTMRVIDDRFFTENDLNVQTYLLLASDLKGSIENPKYYFDDSIALKERKFNLDLLLRTQGWSFFDNKKIENKHLAETMGANLSFYVQEYLQYGNDDKPVVANVMLTAFEPTIAMASKSNEDGIVVFDNINLVDSTTFLVKANYGDFYKEKKNSIKEIYDPITIKKYEDKGDLMSQETITVLGQRPNLTFSKFQEVMEEDWRIKSSYNDIVLEEVVVRGHRKKIEKRFDRPFSFSSATRVLSEEYPSALYLSDYLMNIPGVRVTGRGRDAVICIRCPATVNGEESPLFTLDGAPIDKELALGFPVYDIDYIEVLKGSRAAIYGNRGLGGVISIFTKKGESQKVRTFDNVKGLLTVTIPGYYQAREYYNPMFIDTADKKAFSSTLYWNAKLTGNNVQFKTPEFPGKYVVAIEGISADGEPIVVEKSFEVY